MVKYRDFCGQFPLWSFFQIATEKNVSFGNTEKLSFGARRGCYLLGLFTIPNCLLIAASRGVVHSHFFWVSHHSESRHGITSECRICLRKFLPQHQQVLPPEGTDRQASREQHCLKTERRLLKAGNNGSLCQMVGNGFCLAIVFQSSRNRTEKHCRDAHA